MRVNRSHPGMGDGIRHGRRPLSSIWAVRNPEKLRPWTGRLRTFPYHRVLLAVHIIRYGRWVFQPWNIRDLGGRAKYGEHHLGAKTQLHPAGVLPVLLVRRSGSKPGLDFRLDDPAL
jgi:hypothetical protein